MNKWDIYSLCLRHINFLYSLPILMGLQEIIIVFEDCLMSFRKLLVSIMTLSLHGNIISFLRLFLGIYLYNESRRFRRKENRCKCNFLSELV